MASQLLISVIVLLVSFGVLNACTIYLPVSGYPPCPARLWTGPATFTDEVFCGCWQGYQCLGFYDNCSPHEDTYGAVCIDPTYWGIYYQLCRNINCWSGVKLVPISSSGYCCSTALDSGLCSNEQYCCPEGCSLGPCIIPVNVGDDPSPYSPPENPPPPNSNPPASNNPPPPFDNNPPPPVVTDEQIITVPRNTRQYVSLDNKLYADVFVSGTIALLIGASGPVVIGAATGTLISLTVLQVIGYQTENVITDINAGINSFITHTFSLTHEGEQRRFISAASCSNTTESCITNSTLGMTIIRDDSDLTYAVLIGREVLFAVHTVVQQFSPTNITTNSTDILLTISANVINSPVDIMQPESPIITSPSEIPAQTEPLTNDPYSSVPQSGFVSPNDIPISHSSLPTKLTSGASRFGWLLDVL